MKKLEISAEIKYLDEVLSFIDKNLELMECPMKTQAQLDVAVEEIFVNIARYAYGDGHGNAEILFGISEEQPEVTIEFRDRGSPFNPLIKEDPDTTLSAEERKIGGLGIFMVKKSMDDISYRYEYGQNILRISKKI